MRTVIEDEAVRLALDHARDRWEGTDSAWEALTWVLAHEPREGQPITESGKTRAYVYVGARSIKHPTIEVIYIDDDPFLTFVSAEFREADASYSGNA